MTNPRRTNPRRANSRRTNPRRTNHRRTNPRRTTPRKTNTRRIYPRETNSRRNYPKETNLRKTTTRMFLWGHTLEWYFKSKPQNLKTVQVSLSTICKYLATEMKKTSLRSCREANMFKAALLYIYFCFKCMLV